MNNQILSLLSAAREGLASGARLAPVFDSLRQAAALVADPSLAAEVRSAESRYFYLLRFLSENSSPFDPTADVDAIKKTAARIMAKIQTSANQTDSTSIKGSQLRFQARRPEENIESLVSDYIAEHERLRADTAALTDSRRRQTLERLGADIFKRLWASDPYTDDEVRLLETVLLDATFPAYFRESLVHAIGLGAENYPSAWRAALLESAMGADSRRIAIAAEVWRALLALKTGEKVQLPHLPEIYHAAVRTAVPFEAAAMPDLMELGRRMQQNPLERPDLSAADYEAVKRFADSQGRGDDVFANSLGRMRHFPFFNDMANWFLPFHSDHSALAEIFDGEGAAVAELIEKMPVLTDGDKYALVLSMAMMPASMRSKALGSMVDTLYAMSDSEEFREALAASAPTDKLLVALNITTIKRFYMQNAEGRRMVEPSWLVDTARALAALLPEGFGDVAEELALMKNHHDAGNHDAVLAVAQLLPGAHVDAASCRILGDAYWYKGLTTQAFAAYEAALGADPSDADAALGLAKCHYAHGDFDRSIALLEPLAESMPDNKEVAVMLGTAYLRSRRPERAVEVFHRLDYVSEGNDAKELLAWALTVVGDLENAELFFADAMANASSARLSIRRGIFLWLAGRRAEAIDVLAQARKALAKPEVFAGRLQKELSLFDDPSLALIADAMTLRDTNTM